MTLMIGLHIFFRNVKKMLAKIPCPVTVITSEQCSVEL
jgi:hypothetical protein